MWENSSRLYESISYVTIIDFIIIIFLILLFHTRKERANGREKGLGVTYTLEPDLQNAPKNRKLKIVCENKWMES